LNFVSLFVTPSKGVLPYNSVCLGLQCWSTGFFGNYLREERFREAYDVITEELSSSSSLKFARQRERERERERKEHTRTRNLKPREREQQRIKKAVIVMFFAQQQQHHHLSSNSISISSVTTKRIR